MGRVREGCPMTDYPFVLKSLEIQWKPKWIMESQVFEIFTALEFHPFRHPIFLALIYFVFLAVIQSPSGWVIQP